LGQSGKSGNGNPLRAYTSPLVTIEKRLRNTPLYEGEAETAPSHCQQAQINLKDQDF
jgi:hypothetical protein